MVVVVSLAVFTLICAVAGNCMAGEANEGSNDAGYAQGADDGGYIVDEGEPVDGEIDLDSESAVRLFGSMAKCGDRSYYNPAFAYCANRSTSLVCSIGMHACGGYTCYSPYRCTCDGAKRLSCW